MRDLDLAERADRRRRSRPSTAGDPEDAAGLGRRLPERAGAGRARRAGRGRARSPCTAAPASSSTTASRTGAAVARGQGGDAPAGDRQRRHRRRRFGARGAGALGRRRGDDRPRRLRSALAGRRGSRRPWPAGRARSPTARRASPSCSSTCRDAGLLRRPARREDLPQAPGLVRRQAPWPAAPEVRRAAKSPLCRLETGPRSSGADAALEDAEAIAPERAAGARRYAMARTAPATCRSRWPSCRSRR